jgi:hypothetical protein
MSEKKHQAWNFWSAFVFFALVALTGYFIEKQGIELKKMGIRDALVLILASYRMTRVLVFEKIFKYLRDVLKKRSHFYVIGTIASIITCPWCAGVWVTLVIVVFYYLIPYGYVLVYVLALAGVASLVTLFSNMTQMRAEMKQRIHQKQREEEGPAH